MLYILGGIKKRKEEEERKERAEGNKRARGTGSRRKEENKANK